MQIILNADDFGRSAGINEAVMLAHRQGVLTSASLMVTGEAAQEAVALARQMPTLAVGLHIVLVCGRAALPAEEIPHLVDGEGRFLDDPVRAGLCYFFNAAARRELAREIEAQFRRFADTGLLLSHVDSHLHIHMHPTVFNLVLPLAKRYGAYGLRLPRDDLRFGLSYNRQQAGTKIAWALWLGLLSSWGLRRSAGYRFAITDKVYGLLQSGQMEEAYVVKLLGRQQVPTAEFYFHPTTSEADREALGPNPGDLATLLSSRVRQVIHERGIRLATYPTLGRK